LLVKQGLSPPVQPHITEKTWIKYALKIVKGEELSWSFKALSQTYGAVKVTCGCYLYLKGLITKNIKQVLFFRCYFFHAVKAFILEGGEGNSPSPG
jgi:hypothetical protein